MERIGEDHTEQDVKDMVDEVSTSGNGTIDFPEFLAMMRRKLDQLDVDEEIQDAFQTFNVSGDGMFRPAELKQVMSHLGENMTDKEIKEMIEVADKTGDGQINFEEFKTMMKPDDQIGNVSSKRVE